MMTYSQFRYEHDVKEFLRATGSPTIAEEVKIRKEDTVRALTTNYSMRFLYAILGTNGLSEGAAERLAGYIGIIRCAGFPSPFY
ncbi:MAG: hypothetical protein QXO75_11845 [Nitrososphaerota archaeon]